MRKPLAAILCCATAVALAGCDQSSTAPTTTAAASGIAASEFREPLRPRVNLEVVLRRPGQPSNRGHVLFRQPKDDALTIFLNVAVRDLAPNTDYWFQRATDAANVIDGQCDSAAWLTLGFGAGSQVPIHTNGHGEGRAALFRTLPASVEGSSFDIHFRVVASASAGPSSPAVLESECYQFIATR